MKEYIKLVFISALGVSIALHGVSLTLMNFIGFVLMMYGAVNLRIKIQQEHS